MTATLDTARAEQRRRRPLVTKGDEREQALLDATEDLLRSGGAPDLTVEAIAKRAKLTRTAFYFYFASKEDAVGRIAQRYLGEIFDAARPAFDPEVPIERGIREALDNQVEVWGKHGRALAAVADLAGSDPAIRELWVGEIERFVEPVRERLAAYQREHGLRPSRNNRRRAEAVVWMLERYYYVWASGHYDHPPKAVADTLYEISLAMFELE